MALNILFLGLGHLGGLFVDQNTGYTITGTKRSLDHSFNCSLIPYSLGEKWEGPDHYDVVIISFPPMEDYCSSIQKLFQKLTPMKQLIFISSTSVFGEGLITEDSPKEGKTTNALELIKCEAWIREQENSLIIRPGGLIDEQRHPQRFLQKVPVIKKSKTNVNLVHTADVAAFLHYAIENELKDEDFNLVCSAHPTKEELYSRLLPNLKFDSLDSQKRIIDNSKSLRTGFTYQYNNLEWLLCNTVSFLHTNP